MELTTGQGLDPSAVEADKDRLEELTRISAPGVWEWHPASDKFIASDRFLEILDLAPPPSFLLFKSRVHSDDAGWLNEVERQPALHPHPNSVRFRITLDNGEIRWVECHLSQNGFGNDRRVAGTVADITEQGRTAQALVESEERLKLAIEAGKMAVWDVDLETGNMRPSPELNILCGFPPTKIPNLADVRALYDPGELERLDREEATVEAIQSRAVGGAFRLWQKGTNAGDDRTQLQAEVAITTPAGVKKKLLLRAQYALSHEDRPRLTGVLVDVTEAKMKEERLALVARELQHRVKNTLSVVSAIAAQTLRDGADPETRLASYLARLKALATATDLTVGRPSSVAQLSSIIAQITQPYRGRENDPFVISGEDVDIQGKAASALGLVLHELCTNAIKYGALSVPSGQVVVNSSTGDGRLRITWAEQNGPPVATPSRRGFGTRLLEGALSGDVGGSVTLDFEGSGLRCRIELPI